MYFLIILAASVVSLAFLTFFLVVFAIIKYILQKNSTKSSNSTVNKIFKWNIKLTKYIFIWNIVFLIFINIVHPLEIVIHQGNSKIKVEEITVSYWDTLIKSNIQVDPTKNYSTLRWLNDIHILIHTSGHQPIVFEIKNWEKSNPFAFLGECEIFLLDNGKHRVECTSY